MTTNAYLSGNFAPVTEEVTAFDLEVTGVIPEGLDGRLLRNGPNPHLPVASTVGVDPASTPGDARAVPSNGGGFS